MQNANYHKRVYNVTYHNVIYIIDYLSHLINMVTVTTETQEDCGFCDNQRVKILCQKGITLMLCRYSCLITVELGPCFMYAADHGSHCPKNDHCNLFTCLCPSKQCT